jgi:rubrerythrin
VQFWERAGDKWGGYNGAAMTSDRTESRTDANRRYLAYGIEALTGGRPDILQLVVETARAKTIHALNHLRTMRRSGRRARSGLTLVARFAVGVVKARPRACSASASAASPRRRWA